MESQDKGANCTHPVTTSEGNCTLCGVFCQKIFGEDAIASAGRANEKSILKDMQNYPLPEEIKIKAEEIFGKLNCATKRGDRRKRLVFFCIHNAYNEFGTPQDPKILAEMINIKQSEMTKALSMFSEAQTGYKPPIVHISAIDLLPRYCKNLKFSPEMVADVITLAKEVLDQDRELKETYPQKVAAGILLYYTTISGIEISKKEYAKMMQLSEVTINNMYKHICGVHNSLN